MANKTSLRAKMARLSKWLKASLVEMRLSKLNKSSEGLKLKFKGDAASVEVVKSALQADNPLEAELILMRHQFKEPQCCLKQPILKRSFNELCSTVKNT